LSHIVRIHVDLNECEGLVFTAYRPDAPYDVLTEDMVGSGIARKGDFAALWFDAGNFEHGWHEGEEVIVIVEALKDGNAQCNVVGCKLNATVDIQELGMIALEPLVEVLRNNGNIIGFSTYENNRRSNIEIIALSSLSAVEDQEIRPVIRGGYETVHSTSGIQSSPERLSPVSYAFTISPNPTRRTAVIEYAIPEHTYANINVFDVTGRCVKMLVSEVASPGYYSVTWDRTDANERVVPSGVYFLELAAHDHRETRKLILVR